LTIQSVERAFAILRTVAQYPQGIGVTELAARTDLHKSTVSRMLSTLEGVTAVTPSDNGGYQLHPDFFSLLGVSPFPQNLIALARPFMLELHTAVHEDVGLAIPDGDQVLYVDQVSGDQAVQVRDWTGERFPLHTTSTGKLLLAFQSEAFVAEYLARPLIAYTPQTLTEPNDIRPALDEIRSRGCDWSSGEFAEGLNATAAPIFDKENNVIAALNIYGPSFRFPPEGQQEAIMELLLQVSQRLTQKTQDLLL
jgi:DNA-binding IclR family transcriptional regulator